MEISLAGAVGSEQLAEPLALTAMIRAGFTQIGTVALTEKPLASPTVNATGETPGSAVAGPLMSPAPLSVKPARRPLADRRYSSLPVDD